MTCMSPFCEVALKNVTIPYMGIFTGQSDIPRGGTWQPANWKPKLTAKQREEIRQRYQDGETSVVLAAEFGVTSAAIRMVAGSRNSRKQKPPAQWRSWTKGF